jgi:hypothetical protein
MAARCVAREVGYISSTLDPSTRLQLSVSKPNNIIESHLVTHHIVRIRDLRVATHATKLQHTRWHRKLFVRDKGGKREELFVTPDIVVHTRNIKHQRVGDKFLCRVLLVVDRLSEVVNPCEKADGAIVHRVSKREWVCRL